MDYQQLIEEVYEEVKSVNPRGKVADYIPELAEVDADKFGIALVDWKEMCLVWEIMKSHFPYRVFPKCIPSPWWPIFFKVNYGQGSM
jgi:glutaminase